MNTNDLISVIIPVYNMELYLRRCLDSVLNSTYINLEIICINDGSKDSSLDILREYEKKDRRIIIVDQANQKLSAARNAGLSIAKGCWIAFIDSDDWIHPQYFESLLFVAVSEKADIVSCGAITTSFFEPKYELLNADTIQYKKTSWTEFNSNNLAKTRAWAKLYKKSIIGNSLFVSGTEPIEDYYFNTLLMTPQMKYCLLENKLYYYFMREDSAIHTNTGRQSLVFVEYMLPNIEKEKNIVKKQEMIKRCYKVLLSSRYLEMYAKDYKDIKKRIAVYGQQLRRFCKCLPWKDQVMYSVLCSSPRLYRTIRILNDPTLLKHEANLKQRNTI